MYCMSDSLTAFVGDLPSLFIISMVVLCGNARLCMHHASLAGEAGVGYIHGQKKKKDWGIHTYSSWMWSTSIWYLLPFWISLFYARGPYSLYYAAPMQCIEICGPCTQACPKALTCVTLENLGVPAFFWGGGGGGGGDEARVICEEDQGCHMQVEYTCMMIRLLWCIHKHWSLE
jgi:hypothetical protein